MFALFQADYGVEVAPEIVSDIATMSSGHVGILSLLGQMVSNFAGPLNIQTWCRYTSGKALFGELHASSTVQAMMIQLRAPTIPADARVLLNQLLLAPLEYEFNTDTDRKSKRLNSSH